MTVNKQTTKIVQDGVELTWCQEHHQDLNAEAAAKFYIDSVKALQKFKDEDPRTAPDLRKAKKAKDLAAKTFKDRSTGLVMGFVLGLLVFALAYRDCSEPYYGRSGSYYGR